ncbi:MAG: hypothetical protein ACLPZR_10130 [Solirubrobacteraceae bacterium]
MRADSRWDGAVRVVQASLNERVIAARIELITDADTTEKVIDSIHSRDGMYCVDVIKTPRGFTLQTCRRDEGRWHVISRPSEHRDRADAVASARALIATFE